MTSVGRKEFYRSEILRISPVVKVTNVCKEVGISLSAMSKFLNHERYELISINKLEQFFSYLDNYKI